MITNARSSRTCLLSLVLFFFYVPALWGAVDGRITGTVTDQTDKVIVGAMVVATNTAQGIQTKTITDDHGQYAFPSLRSEPTSWKSALPVFASSSVTVS